MKTTSFLISSVLLVTSALPLSAKGEPAIALNAQGKALLKQYTTELETLRKEVRAALPVVDKTKADQFTQLRKVWDSIPRPNDNTSPAERKAIETKTEQTRTESMAVAGQIFADIESTLTSDALDAKLMRIAVLTHATPRGLAEFAQQGPGFKKQLDEFLADDELVRQVLEAGGANGGEYGEMMVVYNRILKASEHARKPGSILQRLALGMAIQMPFPDAPNGYERNGIHGIIYRTRGDVDQVKRYLHFEAAYLNKELDPLFHTLNTWHCRFIGNGQYSEEDMAWFRKMLRTYRPDHIRMEDYAWRYIRMVKSDVPYTSTTHDPSLGIPAQEHIALGGICGRRAFLGRLCTRSFGIPSRASTQTGHGAMSHWTPDGWVICLGAWWSMAWCGPQGGLDFLLDSQARDHDAYQLVRRAQWIGDAYGEPDTSIRPGQMGKNGGFWDSLAFVKKEIIVEQAKIEALELVGGMKLGESDDLIGDEVGEEIEIPEKFKEFTKGEDGSITMPAVGCYSPRKPSDRILFLESWEQGYQLHYTRLGSRPELFKYRVDVPTAGEYELTAEAATVSPNLRMLVRINRDEPLPFDMPYTHGMWKPSKSIKVKLEEGRNTISVTARTPNRGVSIKNWTLKPVN